MGFNFSLNFGNNNPLKVERLLDGSFFYTMFSTSASYKTLTSDKQKIEIVLSNPAVLKALKLNSDLYSIGKITKVDGNKLTPIKELQSRPNKYQTWKQFEWDYCFYRSLGTAYLWRSNNTNLELSKTYFYWLNPAKIQWDYDTLRKLDKLTLSEQSYNEIQKLYITYFFEDGTIKKIQLKEITPFFDLSNSVSGNWYKGNSVIDALYKVISNVEEVLDSQNINLRYSGKFGISGQQDPDNVTQMPMSETEKVSIETKIDSTNKKVHAFKSKVDINRFVSDIANLKLDEQYIGLYFIVCSMFGIPRDVAEASLRGATYENQEKSTGKYISYALQPMADDLMEWLGEFLGVQLKKDWNQLPFMQVFEKDRATTNKTKAETFKILVENGLTKEEALEVSGIQLKT